MKISYTISVNFINYKSKKFNLNSIAYQDNTGSAGTVPGFAFPIRR